VYAAALSASAFSHVQTPGTRIPLYMYTHITESP